MSQPPIMLPDDVYNRALQANVHPADWVNPQPAPRYNLVVLGGGTAGLVTAAGAVGLGAKVALVERGFLGGDCLNCGCVPSKALLRAARAATAVREAGQFGIEVAHPHPSPPPSRERVNFAAVMERLRRLRAQISPHDSAARFRELGVDVFLGEGRFTSGSTVEVAGQTLRFQKAVIATGARAAALPLRGLAEAGYLTNETVFALTELPPRLAVIGAGPIGCELAQAFARLGSKVAVLEVMPYILPREDRDAASVERGLVRDGIDLRVACRIESLAVEGLERVLHLEQAGQAAELRVDAILLGVGRAPNVEGLGLEAAAVAFDPKKGVTVDDNLQTTNPSIYAAGDICSRFQFTHAADAMARIVIQNALFWGRAKASALTIPWCTYTDPELAHVGLYEHEAKERGIAVQTFTQPMDQVDRAILDGDTEGFARVHVRAGTDQILGATIVARHAGEMIAEVTLAMVGKLGLKTLARTIHPYPTQAEALKKLGDAYNRTRLTPLVRRLMECWLAWGR